MNTRSLMFEERSFFDWEIDTDGHCQHSYRKSVNKLGCPQYKCVKCQETKESDPDEDFDWWQMEAVQAGLRADEYYKRALAATDKEERDKYFQCCSKDRKVQATIQALITNPNDKASLVEQKEVEINDVVELIKIESHSNSSPLVDDTLLGELPHFQIGDRVFWKTDSRGFIPCVIEQIWTNKAKVCTNTFERVNVAIADLIPFDEKPKQVTVKKNSWNPQDFGETPMKTEEDGQLTIFFDDSIEPPSPDDYPDTSSYESAWQEWQNNRKSDNVQCEPNHKKKNPIGISFGKTLDQLYNGKTCTRRIWSERTAKTFNKYFEQGVKVPAYDKGLQYGGKIIGWLTLTQKPYQDELINITQADLKAEGFPDYTFDQFLNEFFEGKNQTIWVIWFDFQPNKNIAVLPEVDIESQVNQINEPLGFLTEISQSSDKKQRTFGHGSGYLFRKNCKGKYPQWWFQVEEKGKKRTYYVPKNKYFQVYELNKQLVPVQDILKLLEHKK